MTHVVIDGYNYINRVGMCSSGDASDIEYLRQRLLERLARYRQSKPQKITVVFDAYRGVSPSRQRDAYRGINVLFSRENETADAVIIDWIRQRRAGMVVVTSDRAILDAAKACGVPFMTPLRLDAMIAAQGTGREEGYDEGPESRQGEKKGNPRRLPKRLRKAVKAIDKVGRRDR